MTKAALAAFVLELCHQLGWPGSIGRCPAPYRPRAEFAAPLILAAAKSPTSAWPRRHGEKVEEISPRLLGAVFIKESSLRTNKVGEAGEIGIGQLKPDGASVTLCPDLDIHDIAQNIECAVRLLAYARKRCGPDPLDFLGRYKGWKECGPTEYARRVLTIMDGRGRELWVRTRPAKGIAKVKETP